MKVIAVDFSRWLSQSGSNRGAFVGGQSGYRSCSASNLSNRFDSHHHTPYIYSRSAVMLHIFKGKSLFFPGASDRCPQREDTVKTAALRAKNSN
jgi:hypothetical protein